jgi:hypothetical protein
VEASLEAIGLSLALDEILEVALDEGQVARKPYGRGESFMMG